MLVRRNKCRNETSNRRFLLAGHRQKRARVCECWRHVAHMLFMVHVKHRSRLTHPAKLQEEKGLT